MKLLINSALVLMFFFASCGNKEAAKQKARSLDSLGGALNQVLNSLKNIDTSGLNKALARFAYYSEFIDKNVNDTVDMNEANQLRVFYHAGGNLQSFHVNRRLLIEQGNRVSAQVNALSKDLLDGSIKSPLMEQYAKTESKAASDLIININQQQELWHHSIQEFRNSLNPVEQIIRSRNHGELPTIIKDTTSL